MFWTELPVFPNSFPLLAGLGDFCDATWFPAVCPLKIKGWVERAK